MKTNLLLVTLFILSVTVRAQQTVNQTIDIRSNGINSTEILMRKEDNLNYNSLYSNNMGLGWYNSANNATNLLIDNIGNVGIGTVNPASKLEVQTATNGWPLSLRTNAFNPGEINGVKFYSGYLGENKWSGIASVAEDLYSNKTGLSFYTGQEEKMRLSWDGSLGLGTLNPSAKLNIALGAGAANGTVGLKIGSIDNYPSLELGVENNYDAQIRTYGNNLNIYAGHFRNSGNASTEDHRINFYTSKTGSTNWSIAKMVLTADGYLGIGTNSPTDMLTVAGKIGAREIKVSTNAGADFVFEPDYQLPALAELEQYVKTNKHLPEIPTAKQMVKEGVNLGELNMKLLQKVEELTLHLIEKDKQINLLLKRMDAIEHKSKK